MHVEDLSVIGSEYICLISLTLVGWANRTLKFRLKQSLKNSPFNFF